MNLVDSKHMSCIQEVVSLNFKLAVKMAFDVATSVHKRRHLQNEKHGLTFPTYHMVYQVSFVYMCSGLVFGKSLVELSWTLLSFHQPKDRNRYPPFFL